MVPEPKGYHSLRVKLGSICCGLSVLFLHSDWSLLLPHGSIHCKQSVLLVNV